MNYKTVTILDYEVFFDSIDKIDIPKNGNLIYNTINPHSYVVAKKDELFKTALQNSDILLPDGIGIVYAAKWINNTNIVRITGSELLIHLLNNSNNLNGRCFFLGSTTLVLKSLKEKINKEYPNITVDYFSPPFSVDFTDVENAVIIESINKFQPDILFVGMTAPKQEKWVFQNKDKLETNAICSIGAAFDFYVGTVKRPSMFWQNLRMEWLIRFLKNPLKLYNRNIVSLPIFIADVIKRKFQF